jgi:ubiquinone/menaquinone biosynthesis C-methylase UbiE
VPSKDQAGKTPFLRPPSALALASKYLQGHIAHRQRSLAGNADQLQAQSKSWCVSGDLFRGNAECLPFADSSYYLVFHVGGINFLNNRAKAIREMFRVAKPGRRILITDETEEN